MTDTPSKLATSLDRIGASPLGEAPADAVAAIVRRVVNREPEHVDRLDVAAFNSAI